MTEKKKVFEMYDKSSKKWIKAVMDEGVEPKDKSYMLDFVLAQIEIFTVMDEMEMGVSAVEKN
jgi:hypothetical protein|tara:strand:+ start:506 stop:694 length:189 start_codon:yes stop_codon:yes gene_type:complete